MSSDRAWVIFELNRVLRLSRLSSPRFRYVGDDLHQRGNNLMRWLGEHE